MKGKQALFDVIIVLAFPAIIIGGYYLWGPSNDTGLLSLVVAPQPQQEFGVKARAALAALKSISMDGSLFQDPVFKSLEEFHVDITPSALGRMYPFATPDALRSGVSTKSY